MVHPNYNILIVEENLTYALELRIILLEIGYETIVFTNNAFDALDFFIRYEIDVILMEMNIRKHFERTDFNTIVEKLGAPVILMTNDIEYKKYELNKTPHIIGLFTKPISPFTLESTIHFALQNDKQIPNLKDDFICIENKHKNYHEIRINEIKYIKISRAYLHIFTCKNSYINIVKFKILEHILSQQDFMRVHDNYIINTTYIKKIDKGEHIIKLGNVSNIPLGNDYQNKIWKLLQQRTI